MFLWLGEKEDGTMCKFCVHIEYWSQEEEEIPSDNFKLVPHLVGMGCTCRFHDRRIYLFILEDPLLVVADHYLLTVVDH